MRTLLYLLLLGSLLLGSTKVAIKGYVKDSETKEPLENCNIYIKDYTGTATDSNGYFALSLPADKYTIVFSYVGYNEQKLVVDLTKPGKEEFTIFLKPTSFLEDVVMVRGEKLESSLIANEIKPAVLNRIPNLHNDVLRSVKMLPGVSSNNELTSGYNVRGGNFTENLIYLNGYEVFRPFLLRQGSEENQTIVNPDLVTDFKFYNGAFPVVFGDKMSSALEVGYAGENDTTFHGIARANLMNTGAAVKRRFGKFNVSMGIRYASPGLLLSELHTEGSYKPSFYDFQSLIDYNYSKNGSLELFLVHAKNEYDLKPDKWDGNFKSDRGGEINQVSIYYDGYRDYSFNTNLAGLRLRHNFSEELSINSSVSYFENDEKERTDMQGSYYFIPDAEYPDQNVEYLKDSDERVDNYLDLNVFTGDFKMVYKTRYVVLNTGLEYKHYNVTNNVDEFYEEEGSESLTRYPVIKRAHANYDINNYSGYVQASSKFWNVLTVNLGTRYTHYSLTNENLFSPRLQVFYKPKVEHLFKLSWGYYYQTPFFYLFRNNGNGVLPEWIKSQKSVHYVAGWEYHFKPDVKFVAEVYYKDLQNIYSFYEDNMRTEYLIDEPYEGYSYGMDLMFHGEITNRLTSWVGYSYLKSRERPKGSDEKYNRRLLDQTHNLQVFLQDKMPGRKFVQSHLRLLFGTGYMFNHRTVNERPDGQRFIAVQPGIKSELHLYFRADMGLTFEFDVKEKSKLLLLVEVLNVFNNYNIAGYEWVQAFKDISAPVRIPQIYSKRFFNVGAEYRF